MGYLIDIAFKHSTRKMTFGLVYKQFDSQKKNRLKILQVYEIRFTLRNNRRRNETPYPAS